jgi:indole-3-glycerol phosphate synthase
MSDFLEDVTARSRQRVEVQKQQISLDQLRKRIKTHDTIRPFGKSLRHPGRVTLIAEFKQASPSAGVIRQESDIVERIQAYTRGGASALSILTEEYYFYGSPHLLETARKCSPLPLLRKDFIVDPYQIVESRSLGADAILLIASLLPGTLLRDFIAQAEAVGLETLVEVHDERDLEHALEATAPVIGINNRDLRTLRVDPHTAERLLAKVPKKGMTLVVESGLKDPSELPHLRDLGVHAVLIGETLMRATNAEEMVRRFVQACPK